MSEKTPEEIRQEVLDRAARYLAYKPRTRHQLRQYLLERGTDRELVEECLDLMEEYHLLDDLQYSVMYMESMAERGRGMARIRRELIQKGVSSQVIEDALARAEGLPSEEERALALAADAAEGLDLLRMDYRQKQKEMGRIAGRLSRRGYPSELVYRSVKTAFARREEEQKEEEQ